MMRATEIADRIGSRWPLVLEQLGIAPAFLTNKHGPCPACGGSDRYRFDNRHGRGGFYCNQCGAGDGFELLQRVHGWDFKTARDRVAEIAGLGDRGVEVRKRLVTNAGGTHPGMPNPLAWISTSPYYHKSKAGFAGHVVKTSFMSFHQGTLTGLFSNPEASTIGK